MEQPAHIWNTDLYNDKHAFVYALGSSLIDLLEPVPNERVLDLGCGSGQLTERIREYGCDVIGMDQSMEMVAGAKLNYPLCNFEVGDAANFQFKEPFDAIFSNATLHWVSNFENAIACMYANLKKGGRIVLEFGGKHNVERITGQLRISLRKFGYEEQANLQLWYFPSIGTYATALEKAGFTVTFAQWYDRPTELKNPETGIIDWLAMFCGPFLRGVSSQEVSVILNEVQEELRGELYSNGKWFADYKRIRIVAYR